MAAGTVTSAVGDAGIYVPVPAENPSAVWVAESGLGPSLGRFAACWGDALLRWSV